MARGLPALLVNKPTVGSNNMIFKSIKIHISNHNLFLKDYKKRESVSNRAFFQMSNLLTLFTS